MIAAVGGTDAGVTSSGTFCIWLTILSSLVKLSFCHMRGYSRVTPWSPWICLTIHYMVQLIHSNLNLFCLDDGILEGSVGEVLHNIQAMEQSVGELGFQLNLLKTETTLLGSPISSLQDIQEAIRT